LVNVVVPYRDRLETYSMNTLPTLTTKQIKQLASIVCEILDEQKTTRIQVDELCWCLFDDIAGLEHITDTKKQEITDEIWRYIKEQKSKNGN
jgi:hypothetical protein